MRRNGTVTLVPTPPNTAQHRPVEAWRRCGVVDMALTRSPALGLSNMPTKMRLTMRRPPAMATGYHTRCWCRGLTWPIAEVVEVAHQSRKTHGMQALLDRQS